MSHHRNTIVSPKKMTNYLQRKAKPPKQSEIEKWKNSNELSRNSLRKTLQIVHRWRRMSRKMVRQLPPEIANNGGFSVLSAPLEQARGSEKKSYKNHATKRTRPAHTGVAPWCQRGKNRSLTSTRPNLGLAKSSLAFCSRTFRLFKVSTSLNGRVPRSASSPYSSIR